MAFFTTILLENMIFREVCKVFGEDLAEIGSKEFWASRTRGNIEFLLIALT